MTQVPHRPHSPSAVPVVPEDAPDPIEPPPTMLGAESVPLVAPEARQFILDMQEAKQLSFAALVVRHARIRSLLRVVWASRREWQSRAEREPLGYVVLDGRTLASTIRLRSITVVRKREVAQAVIDKRAVLARDWPAGIRDVLCEIHPVRDLEGER